jgi:hypothetical protein
MKQSAMQIDYACFQRKFTKINPVPMRTGCFEARLSGNRSRQPTTTNRCPALETAA